MSDELCRVGLGWGIDGVLRTWKWEGEYTAFGTNHYRRLGGVTWVCAVSYDVTTSIRFEPEKSLRWIFRVSTKTT